MPLTPTTFKGERFDIVGEQIPDPAANAVNWTPGGNRTVQLVSVQFNFQTAAVAGDRLVRISGNDLGGNPFGFSPAAVVQKISLTWSYRFSCGVAPLDLSGSALLLQVAPLECALIVKSDGTLSIGALGANVADRITSIFIRYWVWKEE